MHSFGAAINLLWCFAARENFPKPPPNGGPGFANSLDKALLKMLMQLDSREIVSAWVRFDVLNSSVV